MRSENDRPYSAIKSDLASELCRKKHGITLGLRSKVLPVGRGTEQRAIRCEIRSAVPIADLEKQAAELEEQLARAASKPALLEQRRVANNACQQAEDYAKRHCHERTRAKATRDAFAASKPAVESLRERIAMSIDRLKAGVAPDFGRLSSIHEAIEALDFAAQNHGARVKSHDAIVKGADCRETQAGAEHKIALAAVQSIDAQLEQIAPKPDDGFSAQ